MSTNKIFGFGVFLSLTGIAFVYVFTLRVVPELFDLNFSLVVSYVGSLGSALMLHSGYKENIKYNLVWLFSFLSFGLIVAPLYIIYYLLSIYLRNRVTN